MNRNPSGIFSIKGKKEDEEEKEDGKQSKAKVTTLPEIEERDYSSAVRPVPDSPDASPSFLGLFAQGIAAGMAKSDHPDAKSAGAAMGAAMEPMTERMKLDQMVELERRFAAFDEQDFVEAMPDEANLLLPQQAAPTPPPANEGISKGVVDPESVKVTPPQDRPGGMWPPVAPSEDNAKPAPKPGRRISPTSTGGSTREPY